MKQTMQMIISWLKIATGRGVELESTENQRQLSRRTGVRTRDIRILVQRPLGHAASFDLLTLDKEVFMIKW